MEGGGDERGSNGTWRGLGVVIDVTKIYFNLGQPLGDCVSSIYIGVFLSDNTVAY